MPSEIDNENLPQIDRPIISLTRYVWPLSKPVLLSEKLGIFIRNPDAKDVKLLSQKLQEQAEKYGAFALESEYSSLEDKLISMIREYGKEMKKIGFKGLRRNPWEFLAANLLIIEPIIEFTTLNGEESITFDIIESYAALIDFYRGMFLTTTISFVSNKMFIPHKQIISVISDIKVWQTINWLKIGLESYLNNYEMDSIHEVLFDDVGVLSINQQSSYFAITSILEIAKEIDTSGLINDPIEEIYFLGSMINACFAESQNWHLKILILSAILEFFVARNPDPRSFNVDESINRQFQMKSALIANRFDESFALEDTAKFLREAYNIRSKIAHGDFRQLKKEMDKSKFDMYDFETRLQRITIACLRIAVKEPGYIRFIKSS